MSTKRELALQVAAILGHPDDAATVDRYLALSRVDLVACVKGLPGVVARLKAEGQWLGK